MEEKHREHLQKSFVELSDGKVHYELGGSEEGELIVLIHGLASPFFIWNHTFQALCDQGFRVLRFDLFGRGFSAKPETVYNFDLYVKQLDELLQVLSLRQRFQIVGLSMGGAIAVDFAVRHPRRIKKLSLIAPAGFPLDVPFFIRWSQSTLFQSVLLKWFGDVVLMMGMRRSFFDPKNAKEYEPYFNFQLEERAYKSAILSSIHNMPLQAMEDTYRQLGELEIPVQLFWGRNDRIVPFRNSQSVLNAISDIEFHAIDQAGHLPHYEKPEEINPHLILFLKKERSKTNSSHIDQ